MYGFSLYIMTQLIKNSSESIKKSEVYFNIKK